MREKFYLSKTKSPAKGGAGIYKAGKPAAINAALPGRSCIY
jgi:hypothetical protein